MSKVFNITFTVTGPETFTVDDFSPYKFDDEFENQGLEVVNVCVAEEAE